MISHRFLILKMKDFTKKKTQKNTGITLINKASGQWKNLELESK